MLLPELAERCSTHEASREHFLGIVRAASPAQQQFRPAPGIWSMVDVTEHLVLAEEKSLLGVLKGPRPGTVVTPVAHFRMAVVRLVLSTGIRVKVPVPTVVPQGGVTLRELEARWKQAGRGLGEAFELITDANAGAAHFRHPISGWVTAKEGLGFMVGHIRHHGRQLLRIRQAAGFPDQ